MAWSKFANGPLKSGLSRISTLSDRNVTPPKDYAQWATLIRKLVAHWVERYGLVEVRQWSFEVWNEPNLDAFRSECPSAEGLRAMGDADPQAGRPLGRALWPGRSSPMVL